jgi:hypothetical protein
MHIVLSSHSLFPSALISSLDRFLATLNTFLFVMLQYLYLGYDVVVYVLGIFNMLQEII